MAINLSAPYVTSRILPDDHSQEEVVTQTGKVVRWLHSSRKRLQFRVFMPKQSSDNASIANWRSLLQGDSISYDSTNWICLEPFQIEYIGDNEEVKLLTFTLTELK